MNGKYKELFTNLLLPFSWVFILVFCCFLFAFTSHAESVTNGDLPYNVPDFRGANNCIPDLAIEMARDRAIDTIQNYYGYTGDVYFLMFTNDGIINNYIYDVMIIPMPTINYNVSSTSNFRESYYTVTSNYVPMFRVGVLLNFDHTERNLNAGNGANLLGSVATSSLNGETFTPRYPFYMYGAEEIAATNGTVIFTNIEPVVPIGTGHATPPDTFDDPVYNTGHSRPDHVPQLTINNYTWTTPPTPDLSTLENTAKSIFDLLHWLVNNLVGEFSNLITNLQNIGNFIGSTIQYYGNLIISTIQNGITTFYNNMVSLFEPIANAISYISEPVSGTVIYDNISGTTLIQSINSVDTALSTFQGTFTGLSEPNSFVIPIHLENLPSSWFGTQSVQYLDLSWINSDMRTLIRGFMWAIITYALFITIVDSIANYINGGGDES